MDIGTAELSDPSDFDRSSESGHSDFEVTQPVARTQNIEAETTLGKSTSVNNQHYDEAIELLDSDGSLSSEFTETDESTDDEPDIYVPNAPSAKSPEIDYESYEVGNSPSIDIDQDRDMYTRNLENDIEDEFDHERAEPTQANYTFDDYDDYQGFPTKDNEEEVGISPEGYANVPTYEDEEEYDYEEKQALGEITESIEEILSFEKAYTAQAIEIEAVLEPFLPQFLTVTGETDDYLKPSRPDGKDEVLGYEVTDEPSIKSTDPVVFELQLRSQGKTSSKKPKTVGFIQNAEKNGKQIENWIKNVEKIHDLAPAPTVDYSIPMPEIDTLMQTFNTDFEEKLKDFAMPMPYLDCTDKKYLEILCALLDIPMSENPIESLHVLFSLYSEFKANEGINLGVTGVTL
ncbi:hypothetical protein PCE1_001329 [Barthelona sp. PCE]